MTSTSYLTVKALTKYIKRKFDADPHLRNVYVKGELSNVKIHTSGHIYFTIKDEQTRMAAVMFAAQAKNLKFRPESGMNILLQGDVNVYEGSGQYQLYAQSMQPDGIGELFIAFEQLKEKLAKEGLFQPSRKKQIPKYPQRIGVITATTGAAIRDIVT
ncbi:MAG TPA: exodeoxyribonuclease VII large subunit, partial [Paenisporosarcina sp.]|nr:exodeoxyribonuclease VII large subunit [Paenisporosarcina sp.]